MSIILKDKVTLLVPSELDANEAPLSYRKLYLNKILFTPSDSVTLAETGQENSNSANLYIIIKTSSVSDSNSNPLTFINYKKYKSEDNNSDIYWSINETNCIITRDTLEDYDEVSHEELIELQETVNFYTIREVRLYYKNNELHHIEARCV